MARRHLINPVSISLKVEKSVRDFYQELSVSREENFSETVSGVLEAVKDSIDKAQKEVLTDENIKEVASAEVSKRFMKKVLETLELNNQN